MSAQTEAAPFTAKHVRFLNQLLNHDTINYEYWKAMVTDLRDRIIPLQQGTLPPPETVPERAALSRELHIDAYTLAAGGAANYTPDGLSLLVERIHQAADLLDGP